MDPANRLGLPAVGFLASEKATGGTIYDRVSAKGFQVRYNNPTRKIVVLNSSELPHADLIKILYDDSIGTPYKLAFPSVSNTRDEDGNWQVEFSLARPKNVSTEIIRAVAVPVIARPVVQAPAVVVAPPPPRYLPPAPPESFTTAMREAISQRNTGTIQSLLFEHEPAEPEFAQLSQQFPAIALRATKLYPGLINHATYRYLEQLSSNPEGEDFLIALIEAKVPIRGHREILLHNALEHGLNKAVVKLIYTGANLDALDETGCTPLHIAVRRNQLRFVSLLLQKGVNVFIKADGKTALDMAIESGFTAAEDEIGKHDISYLIKRLKNVEVRELLAKNIPLTIENMHELWLTYPDIAMDVKGDYPALIKNCPLGALERYITTEEGVQSIITLTGLGLTLHDNDFLALCQKSPQNMITVINAHPKLAENCSIDVMEGLYTLNDTENLIVRLIDLDALTDPMHFNLAINNSMFKAAAALVDAQVDLSKEESEYGWTPLFLAVSVGATSLVKKMIKANANVNKQDKKEWTPLHLAAQNGHKDIVELLLKGGANTLAETADGKTARELARSNNQTEIAALLDTKELERAIEMSLESKVRALLAEGIALSQKGFFTLCENLPNIALELFDQHHEFAKQFPEQKLFGRTKPDHDLLIVKLLEQGVNPNAEESMFGDSLIHSACHHGFVQTVQKLIELNVDTSKATRAGKPPLHIACHAGHRNVVRVLLKSGVSVWQKNTVNGETALDIVIAKQRISCAKTVLRALGMPRGFREIIVQHVQDKLSLEQITAKILEKVRQDPQLTRAWCNEELESTPLFVAHILGSKPLAAAMMRKLTPRDRLVGMRLLFEKHPQQIGTIIDMFCAVDPSHLALGNLCQFNATPPDTDVVDLNNVAERFMAVTADAPDQKIRVDGHLRKRDVIESAIQNFSRTIMNKERITASPPSDSPAFKEQYKIVFNCIANVIKHLEASENDPTYKSKVIDVSKEITYASWACFAQFRASATLLYQKYCLGIDPTLENAFLQQLQSLRDMLVESMQAESYVQVGQNVHAVAYMKRILGEDLQLMNSALFTHDSCEDIGFTGAVPTKQKLLESFNSRYTASTIFEYIRGSVTDDRMSSLYTNWARKHLKTLMPGYEAYKEKKRQLEEKQTAIFKKMLKGEDASELKQELTSLAVELEVETAWGKTQVESVELAQNDVMTDWLQRVEIEGEKQVVILKPFGIFAALVEQKIILFNTQ